MKFLSRTLLLSLTTAAVVSAQAEPIKRVTFPALSPDGSMVAFSYQGDIWKASSEGGNAVRLTVHPAEDTQPRWTPDGSRIVFTSTRYGNSDLFSMNASGGDLRRLNFESSAEQLINISPDGKFAYGYTSAFGRSDLFRVSLQGGDMIRLTGATYEVEFFPTISPDGKSIAFCSGSSGGGWRNPLQSGSNTAEIWVGDNAVPVRNMRKITNNEWQDLYPNYAPDGKIYFISNRSGWPNLWRMNGDGTKPTQLTQFTEGAMRRLSVSADGKVVAFEFDSEFWRYDVAKQTTTKIALDAPADARATPETTLQLQAGVSNYAVSPDGKRTVIEVRGDLWLIPSTGGTTRRLTQSAAKDELPVWLDNNTILFNTGRTGKRELWTVTTQGVEKVWIADTTDVGNAQLSPDGKMVAYFRGDRQLMVTEAADPRNKRRELTKGRFAGAMMGNDSFSWSPDSKYIAIGLETDRLGTNAHLIDVATGASRIVAQLARSMTPPKFLPNGRSIFFTANEYENLDLYVVDLVQEDLKFTEEDLLSLEEPKKEEPKEKPAVTVKIDMNGILERLRRLTTQGAASAIASPDSKSIWVSAGGAWTNISLATGQAVPNPAMPPTVGNPTFDKSGRLLFVSGGRLLAAGPGAPPVPINFRADLRVDQREEELALFDEIWFMMDRFYYNPAMNNRNWPGIKAKYAKVVPFTTSRTDFYALMGEMMEELDSSHLGATAPDETVRGESDQTGLLGVEWDWNALDARGEYIVASVLPLSPAAHPQSTLMPGDRIVKVNGQSPAPTNPIAKILNGQANKRVTLDIVRDGAPLTLLIKPTVFGAATPLAQAQWVRNNRLLVDKLSNGKLGYVYYASMSQPVQDNFLREIRTQTQGKEGLIIDVRYNGGGSTAQQALGILIKTPWLVRTRRDAPELKMSENIYRGDSLELPSALMINQYSFSNAEIFAEGFRRLKIGPVVGERTGGGVIGTSAAELWDGGSIRMPAWGAYTIDGENLERNGRRADINVLWDPNAALEGRDVQLEAAVRALLKKTK
ncbi:MAG: PD40 domain-containing protein [Chthonomonas sp.]|nr:PD40 domain-containing protein [Chthonomonas sp.]